MVALGLAGTGCSLLPTLNVGMGVATVMPDDDKVANIPVTADVFVKIDVLQLEIEGSVGFRKYVYSEDGFVNEETLNQYPVAATVRYVISGGMARILLGGGLLWSINDLGSIGSIDVKDPLSYRVLAGVDLALVSTFKLGLELSYDIDSAGGFLSPTNQFNTDGFMARVTMGYHF
jgi:hypothetical protein